MARPKAKKQFISMYEIFQEVLGCHSVQHVDGPLTPLEKVFFIGVGSAA